MRNVLFTGCVGFCLLTIASFFLAPSTVYAVECTTNNFFTALCGNCESTTCTYTQEEIQSAFLIAIPDFQNPPAFQWLSRTENKTNKTLHVEAQVQGSASPSCGHVRVYYSFGFSDTANNPVWKVLNMRLKESAVDTYEADIPLTSSAPLSYYGEATDCYGDPTQGIYNNIVTQNRAPSLRSYTLSSWEGNVSNFVGETNHLGFPYFEETQARDGSSSLSPDLDIRALRLKQAIAGGAGSLFIELHVSGHIPPASGETELRYYAVLIQNLSRPDDPLTTRVPEGLFVVLYINKEGSNLGKGAVFFDLEAFYSGMTQQASSSVPYQIDATGKILRASVPLSSLGALPEEQADFLVLAASGDDYRELISSRTFCSFFFSPFCTVSSGRSWYDSFNFNGDVTNTVRFQMQNMQRWPEN